MTVYVDIILLENLCMNYIILFGTAYIIKTKIKHVRIVVSSVRGAVYVIFVYMKELEIYSNFIVKIILSISMIYIAYSPKNIKAMLKELVVFYLVSFALGGCAFALLYIVKPQNIFMKNGVYIGTYPLKIVLLGGIVGFTITYIAFKVVKSKLSNKELIYTVKIFVGEKMLETNVLLDTGNMLKDPISKLPVVLIDKKKLNEIIPNNLLDSIDNILGGECKENNYDSEFQKRLRVIPFNSVGKQNGIILGIKADRVIVLNDIEEIENDNVIIGIYEKAFSKTGKYYGLIGLDMLNDMPNQKKITKDNLIRRRDEIEHITNIKK